ncbi:conserved hypothetical protein [Solidesulfovibrio fructosivorans JJ]]|uniref:Uncharacterized protein n=1 Tax=Solidesulfovibrio fructosivorans JJ] TaxID=596151 RepID=E1JYF2_SOLFR|nr:hypothetical protein [Solidesulfovibrio fructosivorans]EFL50536.1 conserved hypothetical protein [Solidesulfovibrio fructosivorans JJ]]
MKKIIVLAAALTLALSAAPAFAKKGKVHKKAAAPKWECNVGGQTAMTASVNECMKLGGMVVNYPGPDKAAPVKVKKSHKKAKKAKK